MSRTRAADARQAGACASGDRTSSDPALVATRPNDGTRDEAHGSGDHAPGTVLPARDLVDRLAGVQALGPVTLGFGPGLLCARLIELAEEPLMREVVTCTWATRLGVSDTLDGNASACLAALADIVDRLTELADAIRCCTGGHWRPDPDDVALGYAPPNAPVAAVCLLARDVRLEQRAPGESSRGSTEACGPIGFALEPLIRAWCQDADLDVDEVCRTLRPPSSPVP